MRFSLRTVRFVTTSSFQKNFQPTTISLFLSLSLSLQLAQSISPSLLPSLSLSLPLAHQAGPNSPAQLTHSGPIRSLFFSLWLIGGAHLSSSSPTSSRIPFPAQHVARPMHPLALPSSLKPGRPPLLQTLTPVFPILHCFHQGAPPTTEIRRVQ